MNKFLSFAKRESIPIITTNYDTLVERGLTWGHNSQEIDYGTARLCIPHQDWCQASARHEIGPLVLLKLHGSISWQRCRTCGYLAHKIYGRAAASAMDEYDNCRSCHRNLSPALIEPDYDKNYDDPAISEVLERAKHELAHAEIIVFAGYSLPDADKVIRCLFKTSHNQARTRRVVLIDKAFDCADESAANLKSRFEQVYPGIVTISGMNDWKSFLATEAYRQISSLT